MSHFMLTAAVVLCLATASALAGCLNNSSPLSIVSSQEIHEKESTLEISKPNLIRKTILISEDSMINVGSVLSEDSQDMSEGQVNTETAPIAHETFLAAKVSNHADYFATAAEAMEPTIDNPDLISFFIARPDTAKPGDTVVLEWHTTGALTVTLWHLTPTGQFGEFWTVAGQGTVSRQISDFERNRSTFALTAVDEVGRSEVATTTVALECGGEWFFSDAPEICPAEPAATSRAAVQDFEGGQMIWMASEDIIYVLFKDESIPKWSIYPDTWTEGQRDSDTSLVPPEGLYVPIRGFGMVWRLQPMVRERLGWAMNQEIGYDTVVQRTSYAKYNDTYILARDGSIVHLLPERSGWRVLSGKDS